MSSVRSHYLNTDLDLVSRSDLSSLCAVLEEHTDVLSCEQWADGDWHASVEAAGSGILDEDRTPEDDIRSLLRVLDELDETSARTLRECHRREFNIGWQAAEDRPEGSFRVDEQLLREIVRHDASLAVTIYLSCENDIEPRP